MNAVQLLQFLNHNYNYHRASSLAKDHIINSPWKAWLTAEIAIAYANSGASWKASLHAPYMLNHNDSIDTHWARYKASETPSARVVNEVKQASRCDLLLERQSGERTYIELTCINQDENYAFLYTWGQYLSKFSKIQSLKSVNPYLNIINLLVTHGSMSEANKLYNMLPNQVDIHTWDAENNVVTPFLKVKQSGNNRLFILAATTTSDT